jgi:hypothetical protein
MKSNSHSVIELNTTDKRGYSFVAPYLVTTAKERLPKEVSFQVAKGKRWTDIIVYHQSVSLNFYSQKLIDVLSKFIDISNISYPIHIEACDTKYYVLYNLKEFTFLNQQNFFEAPLFLQSEEVPSLFALTKSNLIICAPAVKNEIIKEKLTNVYFSDAIGLTLDEYQERMFSIEKKKNNSLTSPNYNSPQILCNLHD